MLIKKFIVLLVLISSLGFANNKIDYIKLSKNPTWLKLLYFDEKRKKSEIISDDYFLSSHGKTDPLSELKATIAAYNKPFLENSDDHAVCRFPARYKWLSSKVDLRDYKTINPKCKKLYKSYSETKVDSLSLMFVTGYLGNPASSFGHSFFKLNNKNNFESNLFDVSISYGADVPKDENIFIYMYNGLFGKYSATFSDKYFYTHDLIYLNNELRNIWEYELNLSQEQLEFFKLHIWEILGKKFQYLFLNKNCGYEVSKMLEVVIDYELVKSANFWFAPIETFHTLNDYNTSSSIIKNVVFHPSQERKIHKKFYSLSELEKGEVISLLDSPIINYDKKLNKLNTIEQINIIDFMINYYNYLDKKNKNYENLKNIKREVLLKRFSLPAKQETQIHFENEMLPTQNDKPTLFYMNYHNIKNQNNFATIGFIPYAIQSIGFNNLHGDELVILNSEIGFNKKKAFLKKVNFIRIKRYEHYKLLWESYKQFSWQLDIALENIGDFSTHYNTYISGGIGKSWLLADWFMMYSMLNTSLGTYKNNLSLTPEIGLRLELNKLNLLTTYKKNVLQRVESVENNLEIISMMKIYKDTSLYVEYKYNNQSEYHISTGLQFYF